MIIKKLTDLKKLPNNPRICKGDKFEKLVESIKKFGIMEGRPFLISNRTGQLVIIGGNQRFEACKKLGIKEVPVYIFDNITEEEEKEIIIRDNVSNGEWDMDILANEWSVDGLNDWGLDLDFGKMDGEKADIEDEVPNVDETNIIVQKGDIFQLGEHKLMCGDSTKIEDVEKLMDGEKADMVFTDPPYGMGLDTDYSKIKGTKNSIGFKGNKVGNKYDKVKGDNEDFTSDLIQSVFAFNYCKEIFIWGADYFVDLLPNYGKDGSWIVWNKRSSEAQQRGIGNCFELCWSKQKHKRIVIDFEWFGFLSKDDPKEARNRVHPTMKPTKLIERFINEWGKDCKSIVDIFGGSGSTLIASEKTNRKCYMMEFDEKYIQVILKRYNIYTNGQKEIKCLNRTLDLKPILEGE